MLVGAADVLSFQGSEYESVIPVSKVRQYLAKHHFGPIGELHRFLLNTGVRDENTASLHERHMFKCGGVVLEKCLVWFQDILHEILDQMRW